MLSFCVDERPTKKPQKKLRKNPHFVSASGCLSGRGQAESEAGGRVDKGLVQQMEEVYISLPVRLPELNPVLNKLYQDWLHGPDSDQASKLLHTEFKGQSQSNTQPPHMEW